MKRKIATLLAAAVLAGFVGQSGALARSGAGYGHIGGRDHAVTSGSRMGAHGRGAYAQSLNNGFEAGGYPHRYDDCFRPVRNHEIPGWPWNEVYTCNYSGQ